MTMKTKKEVAKEVDKLKRLRAVMPQFSVFGDDNWKKIDEQVSALQRAEGKDERWVSESAEVAAERGEHTVSETYDWLLGDMDENLADEGDIETFSKKEKP